MDRRPAPPAGAGAGLGSASAALPHWCYTAAMGETFLSVQSRGTVALPPKVRRRLHLDRPGAQVRMVERPDGVIELHPVIPVPSDQAWFWTERWQRMEREADADVAAGGVVVAEGPDTFLAGLDS